MAVVVDNKADTDAVNALALVITVVAAWAIFGSTA
jgi:hypothetical protein